MLIPWLRVGHFIGLALWVGGLLALTRLLMVRARAAEPAPIGAVAASLYRWLCGPGAFLTLFSGVGLLHSQTTLLRQPYMHVKLALVAGLFVVDHLVMRQIQRPATATLPRVAHAATWLVLLGAVLLVELEPWAR